MPEIRRAVPQDEPAIRACAAQAYAPYVAAIGRRPAPMDEEFTGPIHAGHVQIAEDSTGEFMGFIVFYEVAGTMHLETLAVCPEFMGRGIGKALISRCEQAARQSGLPTVALYTNEKMTDNLSIYPHLGYVEVARRHEDGFNRVYFEKPLT